MEQTSRSGAQPGIRSDGSAEVAGTSLPIMLNAARIRSGLRDWSGSAVSNSG